MKIGNDSETFGKVESDWQIVPLSQCNHTSKHSNDETTYEPSRPKRSKNRNTSPKTSNPDKTKITVNTTTFPNSYPTPQINLSNAVPENHNQNHYTIEIQQSLSDECIKHKVMEVILQLLTYKINISPTKFMTILNRSVPLITKI